MPATTYAFPNALFEAALAEVPHPLVFATVSGSHLYGFPSVDSDFDLRCSHLLPGEALWGLGEPRETLEPKLEQDGLLAEVVSHDFRKFCRLLLKRNGYVLEQLTSPLVIRSGPIHRQLVEWVPDLLTRNHYHHYRGFYHTERKELDRSQPPSVKKLQYCYRVLMTGCVLLREGIVEANLPALNARFGYRFLEELIAIKVAGELATVPEISEYVRELDTLEAKLDHAFAECTLPENPPAREAVERLAIEARREGDRNAA